MGDFLIGAPSAGASDVVFGGAGVGNGGNLELSALAGTNGFKLSGSGLAVSTAGDVNGDGVDDVLIGAPFADPNGELSGASYVVFGQPTPPPPPPPPPPVTCNGLPATIVGTNDSETIIGTLGPDVIVARGGNDTVYGRAGNDVICGNTGNDRVFGNQGNDHLDVGNGKDILKGGRGNDRLFGKTGPDAMDGQSGNDFCNGDIGIDTATSCEQTRGVP